MKSYGILLYYVDDDNKKKFLIYQRRDSHAFISLFRHSHKLNEMENTQAFNQSTDICVYNYTLVGTHWKKYLKEASRILKFNGEMIITHFAEEYLSIIDFINDNKSTPPDDFAFP